MNKTKKNIVLVGFSNIENKTIAVPSIGKNYYLNNMNEAKKHQGFLIIINNKENTSIINFDKKYRSTLNKYEKIWLYNENYNEITYKWSRIETKNRDLFLFDSLYFWDLYDNYKYTIENKKIQKYTKKRLDNINNIYNYLKKYKTITTLKLANDLKINVRTIERYMHDINNIYHNIGYDYTNKIWYIV